MREIFGIDFKSYRRGEVEFDGVAFGDKVYVLEVGGGTSLRHIGV